MPAGRADLEPYVRSPATSAAVAGEKPGVVAPADTDFNREPPNGTIVVDDAKLYVRINGVWESFTPDV